MFNGDRNLTDPEDAPGRLNYTFHTPVPSPLAGVQLDREFPWRNGTHQSIVRGFQERLPGDLAEALRLGDRPEDDVRIKQQPHADEGPFR